MLDDVIKDSSGEKYKLRIESEASEDNAITIYKNTTGEFSGLSKNNESLPGESLCYRLQYTNRILDTNAIPFIIRAIIMVGVIVLLWAVLYQRFGDEKIFLYLWCSLSLLFTVTLTLFNVPDEEAHFYRAYEISYGDMVADFNAQINAGGFKLPIDSDLSLLKRNWQSYSENRDMAINLEDASFKTFSNTALYAPISYIPQSIGIFVARHLTTNIAAIAYAGRFCNWLAITFLLMMAIRLLPYGRRILMLIALTPMNIQESISLAPDGMVVAISAMMIALVLHYKYRKENYLNWLDILVLYLGAWLISLYKIVYLPFCMIYLLIPKEKFKGGIKEKVVHAGIVICSVAILNLAWLQLCNQFLTTAGTNGELQVQYILHHPIQYGVTFIRTYLNNGLKLLLDSFGNTLGWLSISTAGFLIILYLVGFTYALNPGIERHEKQQLQNRIVFGLICVAIIILMTTSLYVQWTPVYNDIVDGLQGRYYLALFLPMYFMITKDKPGSNGRLHIAYQTIILVTNLSAAFSLLFACI